MKIQDVYSVVEYPLYRYHVITIMGKRYNISMPASLPAFCYQIHQNCVAHKTEMMLKRE